MKRMWSVLGIVALLCVALAPGARMVGAADTATLTVTKVVSGGTATPDDFDIWILDPDDLNHAYDHDEPADDGGGNFIVTFTLDPGDYKIHEDTQNTFPNGEYYVPSFSVDSTDGFITVSAGGSYEVTLTNTSTTAPAEMVSLNVQVDGATNAFLSLWDVDASDYALDYDTGIVWPIDGTNHFTAVDVKVKSGPDYEIWVTRPGTSFVVKHFVPNTGTEWTGVGLPVGVGEDVTHDCNIHFTEGAFITLEKLVVNDDLGTAVKSDFTPYIDGYPVVWDQQIQVASGTHTITETGPGCYAASFSSPANPQGEVTVSKGDDVTVTVTNDDQAATITLVKTVVNDDGGTLTAGDFQAYIDDTAVAWNTPIKVTPGAHTIKEDSVAGYQPSSWGGDGSGAYNSGNVTAVCGENKTATITNDDIAATITLVKTVVNDDGGTRTASDFQGYIDGTPVPWDTPIPVLPGARTVSESTQTDYQPSNWGGDGSGAYNSGSVTAVLGQNKTATITNDDIAATITLVKTVVNDDGGSAVAGDFQAYIDDTAVDWNTPIEVTPGAHTIKEDSVSGYQPSSWGGDGSGTYNSGSVTAVLGQNKTATITNDDEEATLTIIKHVINDNGGTASASDFTLTVKQGTTTIESDPGLESPGREYSIDAGTYTISETGPAGYGATYSPSSQVTLLPGESKTVTVTNDDIPPETAWVTLIKEVVNDNGGSLNDGDFQAYIDGSPVAWNTPIAVTPGERTVSEDSEPGYQPSNWSGDASGPYDNGKVTAVAGESKTCYISNDDITATVTLHKTVVNDDGGTAVADDFQAYIDGSPVAWETSVEVDAGSVVVSEGTLINYQASDWTGDCDADGNLDVALGTDYDCYITNDDIPGSITITKSADPTSADPGDTVTYTIAYENTGDFDLTNVVITDDPDETYVTVNEPSISDGGTYDGDEITWNIGTLGAGVSADVTYDVTLQGEGAFGTGTTTVDNIAVVTSDQTDPEDDDATVTVTISPPPTGGGGTIESNPICFFDVDMLGNVTRIYVSCQDGACLSNYEPEDPDDIHFLEFTKGTQVAYERNDRYNGGPPRWIRMRPSDEDFPLPGGTELVGEIYSFIGYTATGKEVTTVLFDREVGMQLDYDPDDLPDNATSVGIAVWDPDEEEWIIMPQSTGRVAGVGTATADVTHFSTFAVLATTGETVEEPPAPVPTPEPPAEPVPARFSGSGLLVVPSVDKLWGPLPLVTLDGRDVTVAATISNMGELSGTYTAELWLNGEVIGTQDVELAAGEEKIVRFKIANVASGDYSVELAGMTGYFKSSRSINWWVLGSTIGLATTAVFILLRRERRRRRLA